MSFSNRSSKSISYKVSYTCRTQLGMKEEVHNGDKRLDLHENSCSIIYCYHFLSFLFIIFIKYSSSFIIYCYFLSIIIL